MPVLKRIYLSFSKTFCFVFLLLTACAKQADPPSTPLPQPDPVVQVPGVKSYLALGDSYTIGQSVPVADRFPVQLVAMLRTSGFLVADPEIIATTGWTTGNLLEAVKSLSASQTYDVVSLLIGVNNQYQGRSIAAYRTEFTTLLNRAIQFAGNRPANVVVISIPDYSVTPYAQFSDREKIASEIDAFNKVNKEISDQYKVNYVDVTGESRKAASDEGLIAGDGLHFSGKEYKIWSALLLPVFKTILR